MARPVSLLTIVCLCLICGMGVVSYGDSRMNPALMQEHIEEVKRTKPKKYQTMVEEAQGNIEDCVSCHEKVDQQNRPSDPPP